MITTSIHTLIFMFQMNFARKQHSWCPQPLFPLLLYAYGLRGVREQRTVDKKMPSNFEL